MYVHMPTCVSSKINITSKAFLFIIFINVKQGFFQIVCEIQK